MKFYLYLILLCSISSNLILAQNCVTIQNLPDTVRLCSASTYTCNPSVANPSNYNIVDTFWTPAVGVSNPNIINPILNSNNTYTLNIKAITNNNIVVNGDFSSGASNFTTQYIPGTGGPWGLLSNPGEYAVDVNPNNVHSNFYSFGDHTTGTGQMLIVNGASVANISIWCQTISVTPNTDYAFSCWGASPENTSNPAILQFNINNTLLGTPFTLSSVGGQWQQFYTTWNSGSNTTATICIVNQNTTSGGNDFCIDDIGMYEICVQQKSVTVIKNIFNNSIVDSKKFGCITDSFLFSITNTVGVDSAVWNFDDNTGSIKNLNPLHVFPNVGTYNISVKIYKNGCDTTIAYPFVYAKSPFEASFSVLPIFCEGAKTGEIHVSVLGGSPPLTYSINNSAFTSQFDYFNLGSGDYRIVVQSNDGCTDTVWANIPEAPVDVYVLVYNVPKVCNVQKGYLAAIATGGTPPYNYKWYTPSVVNDTLFSDFDNDKNVTLVVTDQNGCTDTTYHTTHLLCMSVPNAFTPNGDLKNDIFKPVFIGKLDYFNIKIYNRYGQQVYTSLDQNLGWDGTYKGVACEIGSYFYAIEYAYSPSEEKKIQKGDFMLMR